MVLIPRCPIFALAVHIGHRNQPRGCQGMVISSRQFWVRGQPGPPLRSCTGFPEGCGRNVFMQLAYPLLLLVVSLL